MKDSKRDDLLETMWGIICNVNGGDWSLQNEMWSGAVLRLRGEYFQFLNASRLGKIKSKKKTESSRKNGKKGGRPSLNKKTK